MPIKTVANPKTVTNQELLSGALFPIIILGLIHSIAYLIIIPPWQHYDEPSHMVRIIAYARNLDPDNLQETQSIRREIASSMLENNFWAGTSQSINLLIEHSPIWIGVSQANDPQFYYQLLAILLKPVGYIDVLFLLYIARSVSAIFYLATIAISYKTLRLLFPEPSLIPIFSSLLLIGIPGFVDIMTAVNNDVLAIFYFTLFLFCSAKIIIEGQTPKTIFGLILSTVFCLLTKSTVYSAFFLGLIALIGTIHHHKLKRTITIGVFICAALILTTALSWVDLSHWMRSYIQSGHGRVQSQKAIHGNYVFQIEKNENSNNPSFFQIISLNTISPPKSASDITLTLGGWVWGEQTDQISPISIDNGKVFYSNKIDISEQPTFFSFSGTFPASTKEVRVALRVPPNSNSSRIYMDGLFLIYGNHTSPTRQNVSLDDSNDVIISNQKFTNIIKNPSAELGTIYINPRIEQRISAKIPLHISQTYGSILELPQNIWYLKMTTRNLLETFWGKFGWGHVPLSSKLVYPILGAFSIIGIIASFTQIRNLRNYQRHVIWLFIISFFIVWIGVYVRGLTSTITNVNWNYIPPARYAYPVILPTIVLIAMGWAKIRHHIGIKSGDVNRLLLYIFIIAIFTLDIYAIYSILQFYAK